MWRAVGGANAVPRPAKAGATNVETLGSHHAPRCGHVVSIRALTLLHVCGAGRPRHAVGPVHRAALSLCVPDPRRSLGSDLTSPCVSLVESLAPAVAEIGGGTACLRILSNLADRRLARAAVRVALAALARDGMTGAEVAERMVYAYYLAAADPYRAATHNKGIMNGIDALAVATGNDWRAIEAGAHAYACRGGSYGSLTTWAIDEEHLVGAIELPMAVSTVGPVVHSHPRVRLALRMLGVSSARELAAIMAAVGLASNLAALRALVTEGIQRGHMALHARAVSHAAGARGEQAEEVRRRLLAAGEVKIDRARELLRALGARS